MEIVPPSSREAAEKKGWDFSQNGLWFAAYDRQELVREVTNYRAANGIPMGNVNQEILDFNAAKTSSITPVRKIANMRELAIKWLESKVKSKPKYVAKERADRRASICITCPNNIQNWTAGETCGRCIENANRAAAIILQGRPQHRPLGACSAIHQQNKVAVWLDETPLTQELPSFCWRARDDFDVSPSVKED
jgi:hypothetical protein